MGDIDNLFGENLLKVNVTWQPNTRLATNLIPLDSDGIKGVLFFNTSKVIFQETRKKSNQLIFDYPFESALLDNGIRLWAKTTSYFVFENVRDLVRVREIILKAKDDYLSGKETMIAPPVYSRTQFSNCRPPNACGSFIEAETTVEKGIRFEQECKSSLIQRGYLVEETRKTGDFGVDLVAYRNGRRTAIQCKNWKTKVNPRAVQEIVAGRVHYGCDQAVVVSQNGFTKAAVELAKSNNVILCTAEEFHRLLL